MLAACSGGCNLRDGGECITMDEHHSHLMDDLSENKSVQSEGVSGDVFEIQSFLKISNACGILGRMFLVARG